MSNGWRYPLHYVQGFCQEMTACSLLMPPLYPLKVMARMNNIRCVEVAMTGDHEFDLDGIITNIDDTTKLIYLVNPNNPTGQMMTRTAMDLFLSRVPQHILVVVDEAYYEFVRALSGEYPTVPDWDIIMSLLRTFFKSYGLAGLRLGYVIVLNIWSRLLLKSNWPSIPPLQHRPPD